MKYVFSDILFLLFTIVNILFACLLPSSCINACGGIVY